MGKLLKYNFLSQIIPQRPDINGNFKYSSYHKHDFIIENESDKPIQNIEIKFVLNKKSKIINAIASDSNVQIKITDNIATIFIIQFQIKQFYNIDFYVTYGDLNDEIEIESELKGIRRSKKLPIKKKVSKKRLFWSNSKIRAFFYDPYTVTIIGGLILSAILAFFFSNSEDSKKETGNIDSVKVYKKDSSKAIHDSIVLHQNGIQQIKSKGKKDKK
jgi:hypothetical protein